MNDAIQDYHIRAEGKSFDFSIYDTYTNLFTIQCHYYGRFNDAPKKEYIEGEICFVDMINREDFKDAILNSVIKSDYKSFIGYVQKHKVMHVYNELVENDEEYDSDSESESDNESKNEIVDVVDEVEVNMNKFKFKIDEEDESSGMDPIVPNVIVSEDNLEEELKILRNDKRRIRVVCNGVVPSKNVIIDKVQGPVVDISGKGKLENEDAKEDKSGYPWLLYLSKGDKRKWAKAQVHLRGDVKVQYALLRDYVCELKRCNPDTTVKIDVYGEEDPETPTRMFKRIYVCLGALKRGFRERGRELLGLDGAFMRGQYPGQKLTEVGVDANNGIYPVAYDRQKGLFPALEKLFPSVEHRKWEISGIPCKHDIAAINDMKNNGFDVGIREDWVHDSYKLQTWMNVYSHKVSPINGKDMWFKFDFPTTLLTLKVHPPMGYHLRRERRVNERF
uniref:Zinc finger PMZ-type domain-containing protein n=1 Tax=Tanacetum cinerariifolium TaxID=118510 RepID=A0A6L2L8Q0_TANCI|nr:hypothetical protein [Tanacetum cinerariifolium]